MDAMPAAISLPAAVATACNVSVPSRAGGVTWKVSSCWSSMAARRKGFVGGSTFQPVGTSTRRLPSALATSAFTVTRRLRAACLGNSRTWLAISSGESGRFTATGGTTVRGRTFSPSSRSL